MAEKMNTEQTLELLRELYGDPRMVSFFPTSTGFLIRHGTFGEPNGKRQGPLALLHFEEAFSGENKGI